MENSIQNLTEAAEAIDNILRRSLMGVYLALNTVAKVKYGISFAELLFEDPEKAVKLVREYVANNEDSLIFIMRAALSALTNDREVLDEIIDNMRRKDYSRMRELLIKAASLPAYGTDSQ